MDVDGVPSDLPDTPPPVPPKDIDTVKPELSSPENDNHLDDSYEKALQSVVSERVGTSDKARQEDMKRASTWFEDNQQKVSTLEYDIRSKSVAEIRTYLLDVLNQLAAEYIAPTVPDINQKKIDGGEEKVQRRLIELLVVERTKVPIERDCVVPVDGTVVRLVEEEESIDGEVPASRRKCAMPGCGEVFDEPYPPHLSLCDVHRHEALNHIIQIDNGLPSMAAMNMQSRLAADMIGMSEGERSDFNAFLYDAVLPRAAALAKLIGEKQERTQLDDSRRELLVLLDAFIVIYRKHLNPGEEVVAIELIVKVLLALTNGKAGYVLLFYLELIVSFATVLLSYYGIHFTVAMANGIDSADIAQAGALALGLACCVVGYTQLFTAQGFLLWSWVTVSAGALGILL
ncbi:hypothetical protein HK102_002652, partial [Quaeritorhiza haematococci]